MITMEDSTTYKTTQKQRDNSTRYYSENREECIERAHEQYIQNRDMRLAYQMAYNYRKQSPSRLQNHTFTDNQVRKRMKKKYNCKQKIIDLLDILLDTDIYTYVEEEEAEQ